MPIAGGSGFDISVNISPDRRRAVVCLAGNLDIDTRRHLSDAVDQLTTAAPAAVTIDLTDVEFAGSVLPDFLAQVHGGLPATTKLTVAHPARIVRLVLDLTDTAAIAAIEPASERVVSRSTPA